MRLSYEFSNILGAVYHRGTIRFSPDGSSIFSPVGNKIVVYDLKANKHDALPLQVNYNISQLCIHPTGNLMLAASEKSHLYMISLANGKLLHLKEYKSFQNITHISFSPDGKYYCVCGENLLLIYVTPGSLIVGKGREICPFRLFKKIRVNHDNITYVSWSADSKLICAANVDTSINVYQLSINDWRVIRIRGHSDSVQSCFFANSHQDDKQLFSLTRNCHLSIWDPVTSDEKKDESGDDNSSKKVRGTLKYQRSAKHYLKVTIDPDDSKETKHLKSNAYITSSDYNSKTRMLAVGFNTGHYALYEMPDANLIYQLHSDSGSIDTVSINLTGDWIAIGSSVDPEADPEVSTNKTRSRLLVWEWQSKSHVLDQEGSGANMTNLHECIAYSLEGTHIVSGNLSGRIRVWNPMSGETVATFGDEHRGPIKSIKFVPNKSGKVILSASLDGTLRAYDLNRFKNFRTFQSPNQERRPEFICLDIDSTGEFIAAGTYNYFEIYLFSLQTGKFLDFLTGHEGPVSGVAFSPITNLLASVSWDSTVRIWNLFEGSNCIRDTITLAHEAIAIAFRPDGHQFAVSTRNGQISLFNPHTVEQNGAAIEGLDDLGTTQLITDVSREKEKYFLTLNYSADGTYILAGGNSNFICIYHANEKILVKKIAMTFNRSMDGIFDYISNRRRNEFGFTFETLKAREEERSQKPIRLPGVSKGDLGERSVMPVIAAYQVVFSPTMRSFSAATTEGVLIYSLDNNRSFNPYKLVVGVDPSSIRRALKNRRFGQSFVEAIQLNDKLLLQEVIESIPLSEMDSIIESLEMDYVMRTLDFIGQELQDTKHLEYYLKLAKQILFARAYAIKNLPPQQTAHTIRLLLRNCSRHEKNIKRICNFSRYSIEYLIESKGLIEEEDIEEAEVTAMLE